MNAGLDHWRGKLPSLPYQVLAPPPYLSHSRSTLWSVARHASIHCIRAIAEALPAWKHNLLPPVPHQETDRQAVPNDHREGERKSNWVCEQLWLESDLCPFYKTAWLFLHTICFKCFRYGLNKHSATENRPISTATWLTCHGLMEMSSSAFTNEKGPRRPQIHMNA